MNIRFGTGLALVLVFSLSGCGGEGSADPGSEKAALKTVKTVKVSEGQIKTFTHPTYVEKDAAAEDFGKEYLISAKGADAMVCNYLTAGKTMDRVGETVEKEIVLEGETTADTVLIFMNDFSANLQFKKNTSKNRTISVIDEISCEIKDPKE